MGAPVDPYHGFKDIAELCEHVITTLFNSSPSGNVGVGRENIDTPPHSPTIGKDQPPQLAEFIAYALYRTRLPVSITHQALLLLHRLKARYPSARGTSTSPHRLFLSSLMLSSKISMDDTYSNKSWQIVGQGLFSLREVNQMERELFAFLGWNVVVRDEELLAWVQDVVEPFEAKRRALAASTAPPRKSMEDRKRRRDSVQSSSSSSQEDQPMASTSRSPSPNTAEARHRRASDAAVALLHGGVFPSSSSSSSSSSPASSSSSRSRRSRTKSAESRPSPYNSRPSSTYSSSSSASSASSSPMSSTSGMTTPGTPGTPVSAGPLTPDHTHVVPSWAHDYHMSSAKDKLGAVVSGVMGSSDWHHHSHHPHAVEAVQVASW